MGIKHGRTKHRKLKQNAKLTKSFAEENQNGGRTVKTVTFFDTREELRELTGLPGDNHDAALWDAGFNLDDWDFGFVSDTEWSDRYGWGDGSYMEWWLLDHMESHCCGYQHTEYNGRHYYIAHHA